MRPCSEEEVRRLLPIQAYSQKQLSDVSVRVDELSRFITAPIRAELDGIEGASGLQRGKDQGNIRNSAAGSGRFSERLRNDSSLKIPYPSKLRLCDQV